MEQISDEAYDAYLAERGLTRTQYTSMELLAVAAAREVPDGAFVFAGTGLPLLASMLAQFTVAPHMTLIMEAGIVGPRVEHLPISVSDPRGCLHSSMVSNMADTFGTTAMRGYCTVGMLGGAECDMYGNLNSTIIGGYWPGGVSGTGHGPQVRFAGSGGANNIASFADKILVTMVQEARRFPERVEYLTSVAGARGPREKGESRWDYGLVRGGEMVMISDLCIMRSNNETGLLELDCVFPGISVEDVVNNTGWKLDTSRSKEFTPPTEEELKAVRMLVDPSRIYLGRKSKREAAAQKK
ncbi:MAG TPA: CoA-transferase [Ktedonobacteraceae bacterium]|nr:CoA-transferase [Ktedonobacteraceae bacterium]